MKHTKLVLTLCFLFIGSQIAVANSSVNKLGTKRIKLSVSEPDATITIDGKTVGFGHVEVSVPKKSCVMVSISKTGFFIYEMEFCNQKGMPEPPRSYYVTMERDDAYDASVQTDIANIDMDIRTSLEKDKAWRLLNQIILTYMDVIELTDKETGYIRTAWSLKTFRQNTIRTRIIVKQSSYEGEDLGFKIKLISEESGGVLTSVKSDELYKEWDRVLRKYEGVIEEMQARVGR